MAIPLRRELPRASSGLPESRNESSRLCPLFGLAPGGVYPARRVTSPAVRSYRTISPLPARLLAIGPACGQRLTAPPAVYFLWHFPGSHDRWTLSTTLPSGARTFLPPKSNGPEPATIRSSLAVAIVSRPLSVVSCSQVASIGPKPGVLSPTSIHWPKTPDVLVPPKWRNRLFSRPNHSGGTTKLLALFPACSPVGRNDSRRSLRRTSARTFCSAEPSRTSWSSGYLCFPTSRKRQNLEMQRIEQDREGQASGGLTYSPTHLLTHTCT